MSATESKPFILAALVAALRANARRRPLWGVVSTAWLLDLNYRQVMQKIEDGSLPLAFNIGTGKRRREPRIFSASVLELAFGIDNTIGATKKLSLPAAIDLILPRRDLRSTELKRLLSCDEKQIHVLKKDWRITTQPKAKDGPNSFTVFSRASVAAWLTQRRIT